jgi:small-conductance mechanosensitive channel/CRP-like cAMP-binding protein
MGSLLEALRQAQLSLSTPIVTLGALVAFLFLRRVVPAERRRRGRVPVFALFFSLLLQTAAWPAHVYGSTALSELVDLFATLTLAYGLTQLAGVIVIDLALGALGLRIPAILRDLLQAAAFGVSVFGLLRNAGVNLLSLLTTSAVLTAVIGLALQDTIANLFSGLALQLDRTLGVGDWIQVGERIGRIDQIKWRSTSIFTRDGDYVILPNSFFLKGEVMNFSKPTGQHRVWIKIGFAYRHPPNEVKKVLVDALRGTPKILTSPEPDVMVLDFAPSAVQYGLRFWIDDYEAQIRIEGEVRTRIWYAARRAGLEIPFPVQTVHLTRPTQDDARKADEREFLERLGALSRVDLFQTLDDHDVELLAQGMRRVHFAVGERIIQQGEPGDSLYLVQHGKVGVKLGVDGHEKEVATLGDGDFFGEMSLVTGEPRTATVEAKSDAVCWEVPHRAFERLLESKPQVAEDVTAILGKRQIALDGQREGISAEAASLRVSETQTRLLEKMRDFFHLGS